jgi:hypothetical protein
MKHWIKLLAICILIQMPLADVRSEWNVLQWQPFQTKAKLVLKPAKRKAVRGKAAGVKKSGSKAAGRAPVLPAPSEKVQRPFDLAIEPANLPDRIWPDVQSLYYSQLAARVWHDYMWQAGIAVVLSPRGVQKRKLYGSDESRDALIQRDLLGDSFHKTTEPPAEDSVLRNIRFSFFNRDMQYINRDIPERDRGRFSSWDLYQSMISQSHSPLEAFGKVFEPKVELGIEF